MNATATQGPALVRHKSFNYRTDLEWLGGRVGLLASEGKQSFRVASPPEFKGESGVWTPEDLLVGAVNSCLMVTFAAFAQRLGLPVLAYVAHAEAVLEFKDGSYQITRVVLRPTIEVGDTEAVARAEKALSDAHQNCIISNSIRASVEVQPVVRPRTA